MAEGRFWVSTGDIREPYDVMNVVSTRITTALGEPNFEQACRAAVDNLAQSALRIGANGVIWIQIVPFAKEGWTLSFYATGTAVRVMTSNDATAETTA